MDTQAEQASKILNSLELDITARGPSPSEKNRGIQIANWLCIKSEIAASLYKMHRYHDFTKFMDVFKKDCTVSKDLFFSRKASGLQARMLIQIGERDKGEAKIEHTIQKGQHLHHDDLDYIILLGDSAELLFQNKEYAKSGERLEEARKLLLKKLRTSFYDFKLRDINSVNESVTVCSDLFENKYDIEQKLGSERIEKGGGKGKGGLNKAGKGKDEKKGKHKDEGQLNMMPLESLNPVSQVRYDENIQISEISLVEQ